MSISHKPSSAQLVRLMVYRRALHPELFDLRSRRNHRHGQYEAETWLLPAGHIVRFQAGSHCMTEAVVEQCEHLPEHGLVHALPCLGEKDYEFESDPDKFPIGYVTTIQTETLTDNLYATTCQEMRDFAAEVDALYHEWRDDDGALSLSVLDVQKFKRELHVQSYHLHGALCSVLRTQSIFEVH